MRNSADHPQGRLRRRNERAVFDQIRVEAPVSRSQLANHLGLSAQAVGSIVAVLLEERFIVETEMPRGAGPGASPIGLEVHPDGAFALGFGLERDRVTGVVLDLGGTVRWQRSAELPRDESPSRTLKRFERWGASILEAPDWAVYRGRFCGVGVAAPGPINMTTGTIVSPPNFPGWDSVDVVSTLAPSLGLPVVIDNAATAAAIAVEWRLPRKHGSFLYCYWGIGIGGALVLGDNPYGGVTGNTLELGHMVVDPFGPPCSCGGVGCLETVASASTLLKEAQPYGDFKTLEQLMAAAQRSPEVAELLARSAERLGAALLSAVNLVDVNQVVLGGLHFQVVAPVFLPIIRRWVEGRAFRSRIAPTKVSVTTLGEESSAVGAAALALHSLVPNGRAGVARQATATDLGARL